MFMCSGFDDRRLPLRLISWVNVLMVGIAMVWSQAAVAQNVVELYIRDDVLEDYLAFVADRDVLDIKKFSGRTIRRDVVDMIIAQQAMAIGGFKRDYQYHAGKVNFRNTRLLQQGKLLISFDSYWLADAEELQQDVYISDPVIRRGEYVAGIYTGMQNQAILKVNNLAQLQQFSAISTPLWRTDWRTIQSLGLSKVLREDEWISMARMVSNGWVDFMLMPLYRSGHEIYELENIRLQPVPGVVVLLNDSRHFVISKHHPDGKAAFDAIQIGLAALREQGRILKAYQQAGFVVDPERFIILNPAQSQE